MQYFMLFDPDGAFVNLEEHPRPVYVFVQEGNGRVLRCVPEKAQGILNLKGTEIYRLEGKAPVPGEAGTAVKITLAEYLEKTAQMEPPDDPEDTSPEVPEETGPEKIMTRAELTEKVMQLDEALELLLSGVTE